MNTDQSAPDSFIYRLVAGIGIALCVVSLACAAFLVFRRIPAVEAILNDFDMEFPALTRGVFAAPWFPLVAPALGLLLGIIAIVNLNRAALAGCWMCVVLALASSLLAWYAVELPMYQLTESLTGG